MDDLLREFLTESSENLLRLEQEMVELEQRPKDADLLGSIFRSVHTIKGTCGFMGLVRLEAVAHATENVLGLLRAGSLDLSDEVVSDVLAAVDVIKVILTGLEEHQEEPAGDDGPLIGRLGAWKARSTDGEAAMDASGPSAPSPAAATPPASPADKRAADARAAQEELDRQVAAARASLEATDAPSKREVQPKSKSRPRTPARSVSDATLRVNVEVLDRLMNLAGELVLTRNQLNLVAKTGEGSAYDLPIQALNRVSSELQEVVMKTRMQPVGNAWGKLPRLVRDLSNATGKKIDLKMVGADTELDRQILQAITDPLTHMIRNSGDHGIELPDIREAAGKPERGQIVLTACHEGGHIVIEIQDDGRGLDADAIRRKAIERGLVSAEVAEDLTRHRIYEYIFEPGFSTAHEVTAVSGRGVGMDVVRRNVEVIGGSIEVDSELGIGTTFRLKIPLTMAIMSALIVGVQGQSFAVPQISVVELVGVGRGNEHLIERVNGAIFFRLRDELLPLLRLDQVLGLPAEDPALPNILVCQVGASRFGLVVDAILDTHEIVVKPVGRMVRGVHAYSGTTIVGDGRVIMILDILGIGLHAHLLSRSRQEGSEDADVAGGALDASSALLVFDGGLEAPCAVPLSRVERLEEFAVDDIERAEGRWVVQYRGRLLPLAAVGPDFDIRACDPRAVIVFSGDDEWMGLAVDSIRDIVRDGAGMRSAPRSESRLGSTVVAGRTTEIVNPDYYLEEVRQGGAAESPAEYRRKLDPSDVLEALRAALPMAGYEAATVDPETVPSVDEATSGASESIPSLAETASDDPGTDPSGGETASGGSEGATDTPETTPAGSVGSAGVPS